MGMSNGWSLGLWAVASGLFTLSYNALGRAFPLKGIVSREYRAVNAVKGSVLAVLAPAGAVLSGMALLGRPYAGSDWWHTWLPAMAAVYAALDLSSMIHYREAAVTTWVHHILVQVFYLYLEAVGYAPTQSSRAIVLLAGISACEFVVNLRLAARGLLTGKSASWVNKVALTVYGVGSYLNLMGQGWLLYTARRSDLTPMYALVLLGIAGVLVDDVYLMRYLWRWQQRV